MMLAVRLSLNGSEIIVVFCVVVVVVSFTILSVFGGDDER